MVRFYRDVLGLRVKFTLAGDDGIEFGYYFACGGCSFIELFDSAERSGSGAERSSS